MSSILVSVIMPVFNGENYIASSVESILTQTLELFELIIIDDGSTDKTLEIINEFEDTRIRIFHKENGGAAAARNYGIKQAKAELIAILDADDVSYPSRLKKQYDFLANNPDFVIVGSNADVIDKNGVFIFKTTLKENDNEIRATLPEMPFYHSSVMFRNKFFLQAGGYPEYMLIAQDRVLMNRLAEFGKMKNMNNSLIQYRIVPTANTNRNVKKNKLIDPIILKAINENQINSDDYNLLKSLLENRNSKFRVADYYNYIARKYLWNNYSPKAARKNIFEAIKINLWSIENYIVLVLSFMPRSFINSLYKKLVN